MSNRTIKKNRHREDFGSGKSLWQPAADAYRGAADAPHRNGMKRGGMPFAACVALGVLHSGGKITDDVFVRLRNGTATMEEVAAFEGLYVEHCVAVEANAEKHKQKREERNG